MVVFMHPLSDEKIETFENVVLGQAYRFTNRALIREALEAPNALNPNGPKTLAMVGDAEHRLYFVVQGRERNRLPGHIQNVITNVASNDNLYAQGLALGLESFIVKNPAQWDLPVGRKTMATTMEAIIGAVYYDSGKNRDATERVITALGLAWPE
ncbi:uncharacterized protein N7515_007503 [Penicillium bovifimosum]|uniref:RNase III domain-containing protein n=1 Tax=Penicillium bovifimosum TaxID=126998 RepID=A0A9W9L1R8_9EURO|nr:uncharacterized protein N7515_007503 [Penicillium bovifimosum]KAJ5131464.1 hypothetical protein N7515_007503 [Penicillium bovifimosum]